MYNFKTLLRDCVLIVSTVVIMAVMTFIILLSLFFPVIISWFTGCWWYMLLYPVMPFILPAAIFLFQFFISLLEVISKGKL